VSTPAVRFAPAQRIWQTVFPGTIVEQGGYDAATRL
jgi:hypothetical protein